MKTPGFTAEAALVNTAERYQARRRNIFEIEHSNTVTPMGPLLGYLCVRAGWHPAICAFLTIL
jgi:hypothetical protein